MLLTTEFTEGIADDAKTDKKSSRSVCGCRCNRAYGYYM